MKTCGIRVNESEVQKLVGSYKAAGIAVSIIDTDTLLKDLLKKIHEQPPSKNWSRISEISSKARGEELTAEEKTEYANLWEDDRRNAVRWSQENASAVKKAKEEYERLKYLPRRISYYVGEKEIAESLLYSGSRSTPTQWFHTIRVTIG